MLTGSGMLTGTSADSSTETSTDNVSSGREKLDSMDSWESFFKSSRGKSFAEACSLNQGVHAFLETFPHLGFTPTADLRRG
jgi:hypothetical protein